jgi:hypothetical protein
MPTLRTLKSKISRVNSTNAWTLYQSFAFVFKPLMPCPYTHALKICIRRRVPVPSYSLSNCSSALSWIVIHRNSRAAKHPRSSTCFNSNCWNLWLVRAQLKAKFWSFNLLLALCVEVYTTNRPLNLIEADVVKALETCSTYCSHSVIRD